jgi:subtilisin family serine protease
MRTQRSLILGIVGLAALLALALAPPGQAGTVTAYLIEAGSSTSLPANLGAMVGAAGGNLGHMAPEIGVATATSSDPAFAAKLAASPGIQGVALDTLVQWTPNPATAVHAQVALTAPPPPALNPQGAAFYGCQWNMQQINAPGAWAQNAFGAAKVEVAVLDTGVDPNHIDLAGHVDLTDSVSVITPGSSPCGSTDEDTIFDFLFHGTFVSSQITGNLIGMAALAPRSDVVMVKVLNCQGSGSFGDIITGINYAAGLPNVQVINMSLGALIPKAGNGMLLDALNRAVLSAKARGKLVVVAAGNNAIQLSPLGPNVFVPAQSLGATAIYATSINRGLASYSNFGGLVATLGAPGGDQPNPAAALPNCPIPQALQSLVLGACTSAMCGNEDSYLVGDGTSFASPLVAGVAAQIDGVHAELRSNPALVQLLLTLTADPLGPFPTFGFGEVDDGRAVLFQQFLP